MPKIEDFGEKIGGAKKDLWRKRTFLLEDLESLSDREAFKYCVKDNIWKRPDYSILCQEKPVVVVWFIKKLRDSLLAKVKPTSNEEKNKLIRKKYVEFVSLVRDIIMSLSSVEELLTLFQKIFGDNGYFNRNSRRWLKKVYENPSITNKFIKATNISAFKISKANDEIANSEFPSSSKKTTEKNVMIKEKDDGFHIVTLKNYYFQDVVPDVFTSKSAAEKYIKTTLKKVVNKSKLKISLRKPELKNITREGIKTRNNHVTTNMMLDTFSFRGGEFGNWANDIERQMHLNYAFDALIDLAYSLNVTPSFISLNKRLGIAFGARGSGNALAHYEPAKVVINLTKMNGAGRLAHEWMHSLDDYLGTLCGNTLPLPYASTGMLNKKSLPAAVAGTFEILLMAIKTRRASKKETTSILENKIKKSKSYLKTWIDPIEKQLTTTSQHLSNRRKGKAVTESDISKIKKIYQRIQQRMYDGNMESLNDLESFYKDVKGIVMDKRYRKGIYGNLSCLHTYISNLKSVDEKVYFIDTDYLKNAKRIDEHRSKPYWSTPVEMLARAFEAYIQDKIRDSGKQSDYLVHHADNSCFLPYKPYPEGNERKLLNEIFDDFFNKLRSNLNIPSFDFKVKDKNDNCILQLYEGCFNENKLNSQPAGQLSFF